LLFLGYLLFPGLVLVLLTFVSHGVSFSSVYSPAVSSIIPANRALCKCGAGSLCACDSHRCPLAMPSAFYHAVKFPSLNTSPSAARAPAAFSPSLASLPQCLWGAEPTRACWAVCPGGS
jgi:hypothetical protein